MKQKAPSRGARPRTAPASSSAVVARPLPTHRLFTVAAAVGLVTGVAEFLWVLEGLRLGFQLRLSAHYVWMIPTAVVLLAVTAAVALWVAGRWWRRACTPPVVAGVLVTLAVAELLQVVGHIHWIGVWALAAGLGVTAGRMAGGRIARFAYRTAPVVAVGLAFLVAVLGTSMVRALRAEERGALAALPPSRGGSNVLLLILDTVRYPEIEGHQEAMPNLARYAARGVFFERAIAPAPWTLPSHASMFTGRWPTELSVDSLLILDTRYPTLAEVLAERGYMTAGFVANLLWVTRGTGLGRGFIAYDDYPLSLGQVLLSSSIGRFLAGSDFLRRLIGYHELLNRRTAHDITQVFLDWEASHRDRAFFAFLNVFDAHEPWFPPGYSGSSLWPGARWTGYTHAATLSYGEAATIRDKWRMSPGDRNIHAAGYWAAVRRVDAEVGRLLDEMDRRGVLQNTVVIIASDHGEQLGEHGLYEHNNSLYLPALHVPLVVLPPGGVPEPIRVPQVVSLRDIPATVMDMLGGSTAPFPGRSLVPLWRARPDEPQATQGDTAFAQLVGGYVADKDERPEFYPVRLGYEMLSLTTRTHHYIHNGDGSEELYDWESDPAESKNLVAHPDAFAPLMQLRQTLYRILADH